MAKKPDSGLCTSNKARFLKSHFKSLLFCLHTFGVRRTIDVLDSENQPGSGKTRTRSGALGDVRDQKYDNKKNFIDYLKYSFNIHFRISLSLRYRAPDPVFGQNRNLIPGYRGGGLANQRVLVEAYFWLPHAGKKLIAEKEYLKIKFAPSVFSSAPDPDCGL